MKIRTLAIYLKLKSIQIIFSTIRIEMNLMLQIVLKIEDGLDPLVLNSNYRIIPNSKVI